LAAAVQSLRALPVGASLELVRQTRLAVRSRAQQLQAARARSVPLWIATVISSVSMILTTPYVWQTFAWIGRMGELPGVVWQVGFLMWWFMVAVWRHTARNDVFEWGH
jgi:hypothetical protein